MVEQLLFLDNTFSTRSVDRCCSLGNVFLLDMCAYSQKATFSFIMSMHSSICLSTCISLAPTGWKFDIADFHQIYVTKSKFG